MEVVDNRLNELSSWEDDSLDDWLLNDKGLEWWGVDARKSAVLSRKFKQENKKEEGTSSKTEEIPRCPCCGKPLHKSKAVLL